MEAKQKETTVATWMGQYYTGAALGETQHTQPSKIVDIFYNLPWPADKARPKEYAQATPRPLTSEEKYANAEETIKRALSALRNANAKPAATESATGVESLDGTTPTTHPTTVEAAKNFVDAALAATPPERPQRKFRAFVE